MCNKPKTKLQQEWILKKFEINQKIYRRMVQNQALIFLGYLNGSNPGLEPPFSVASSPLYTINMNTRTRGPFSVTSSTYIPNMNQIEITLWFNL